MKKLLLTVVLGLCTLAGFSQAKFDVHAGMSCLWQTSPIVMQT